MGKWSRHTIFPKGLETTWNLPQPIKMTLEIDGHQVTVEVQDVEEADAGLKAAARFYEQYPDVAKKVTPLN